MDNDDLTYLAQILRQRRTIDENGCWIYRGTHKGNYRIIKWKGVQWGVHRLSYYIYKGQHPGNLFVCHTCDVRSCFNPDHLFLGTAQDNADDMRLKGRSYYHNHPEYVEAIRNGLNIEKFPVLKREDIEYIKRTYKRGSNPTMKELAQQFGVSIYVISKAVNDTR